MAIFTFAISKNRYLSTSFFIKTTTDMKRALLITTIFSFAFVAFGQYRGLPVRTNGSTMVKAITNVHPGGGIVLEQPAIPPATGFRSTEEEIGTTNFDVQTTASLGRRIGEPGNGHIGAAWQMAFDPAPGFGDRGTGYNHFDGSSWGPNPTDQVESSRSGYPSYTVMGDGTEVVISHKALTAGWQLIAYTKAVGATTWTEHILPSDVPSGNVWAKIAAGGPDGKSLHVVAITLGTGFQGQIYKGVDAHPLYWRSLDGGETWDKKDIVLPNIDSTKYLGFPSESYAIEANDETVAIGFFPISGDKALVKSTDNGETWTHTLVKDFPLDKWAGYAYDTTLIEPDPNYPLPNWFLSSDNSGSLVIDNGGKVHLFFGDMYVYANPDTTFYNIDVGTNGISYWNEDMSSVLTVTGAIDWNNDDTITIGGDFSDYYYANAGISTFPIASVDDDDNLYLVFTSLNELYTDADGLTYRHIFITKSVDGGETWSAPFDLINEDITDEPEFIEAAFPSIPARTGDVIQLIYQQDYIPGLTSTIPNTTPVPDQFIMHFSLDKETFGPISSSKEPKQTAQKLVLSPNPAHSQVQVSFDLATSSEVGIGLYDLFGQQISYRKLGRLPNGEQRTVLGLRDLPSGVYAVKVVADGRTFMQKLVVD